MDKIIANARYEIAMHPSQLTKGTQTREHLLETAFQLFLEQGYHAATMRQLVERSGITMGGVYNHFSGKEELFVAVLHQYHPFDKVVTAFEDMQRESAEELITDLARRMVETLRQNKDGISLMLIEAVEFRGSHYESIIGSVFPRGMKISQRLLNHQQEIRFISPKVLFRSFIGFFFAFYMSGNFLGDFFSDEEDSLKPFIDIYLHGVLKP